MNVSLIDKKNIHNNFLQVINQYEESGGSHDTRYDVTILVNGLPLVHVELKRRGVALKEAFNQINRYQRVSFWAGCGLYEYVQIFVISNGTHTKYYSNTTRDSHIREQDKSARNRSKKTSNSFEFTSYWADANNQTIPDLVDFTKTFFARHTLLNILTRYCVFTSENLLLVMRPYQIVATERILNRIEVSTNYKKTGTLEAGGYIWHTTGSGKTLTSFKTAQLATALPCIDKVLFVVDRKDLDYQTIKDTTGSRRARPTATAALRCCSDNWRIGTKKAISTLTASLSPPSRSWMCSSPRTRTILSGTSTLFWCSMSATAASLAICTPGSWAASSKRAQEHQGGPVFQKLPYFGFTGTPIMSKNAASGGNPHLKTTAQAFGEKLHTYTIVDAINDGNVLPSALITSTP